jgi:protein-tyrosine phosphatase
MNKDYMFGKTSYLPKIQYNQLISNQNNQNRVNYLELSLNNRNTLSPYYNLNNNNSSIARNSNSFRNTFSSSKIGHYYPLSSNNLNNDYNNFTPKRLERRNQSSNQENLNSNQFYHLVKTNPKLLKNNNQNYHNQISSFTSSSPKKNVSNSTKSKTFSKTTYKSNNKKICPLCKKEIKLYVFNFHFSIHPSQIFPWLYLGSYRNACDKEELKNLNITYILNCAVECYNHFPKEINYCHLKLNDLPNFRILPHLNKAISFIEEAHNKNANILVHCQMGISRSTSCVIAYFIKVLGYKTMGALQFIKKKRKQVMPNFGFLEQLIQFEKSNLNYKPQNMNGNNFLNSN